MASQKSKSPAAERNKERAGSRHKPERPGAVTVERDGPWERQVRPFLIRHSVWLAILVTAAASLRIISTYNRLSLTYDEPAHFASGLSLLSQHVYHAEAEHPPLARAAAALLPY